jgi:CheY-like chemotaxis protein
LRLIAIHLPEIDAIGHHATDFDILSPNVERGKSGLEREVHDLPGIILKPSRRSHKQSFRRFLELGCEPLRARSGTEALGTIANDQTINVLITDINMPGLDGSTLATWARSFRPELPIILITGNRRCDC